MKFTIVICASRKLFTTKLSFLILIVKGDIKGSSHIRMPGLPICPKTFIAILDAGM